LQTLGVTTSGISNNNIDIVYELNKNNISLIDCSLTNLLSKDWKQISQTDVEQLSDKLENNFVKVNSIQSIFYNKNFNFSNNLDLKEVINHLQTICSYAKILKCKKILFGSPKQRQDINSFNNFIETFKNIDLLMNDNDIIFNIENLEYQQNVLLKQPSDIIDFIELNDLKKCRLNLHLFVENQNLNLIENPLTDTIHFSDYNYTDSIINSNFMELKQLINQTKHIKKCKILEFNTEKTNITLKNIKNLFDLLK
jgi:hypothetical protein